MRDTGRSSTAHRAGRRRSAVRAATMICAAMLLAASAAGCSSSVDGSGSAAPGEVAAYSSDVAASRESAGRDDASKLCREAMSSMVVMVRGYNAFVRRLTEVHTYSDVGDLDDKARASLIAGADLIRQQVTEATPADVADPANRFLDSTGRLGAAIGQRQLDGLNPVAAQWTRDKQATLNACSVYLPLPPTVAASPVPTSGASDAGPSSAPTPPPTP
ncbi:hypothetical protein [Gordonia hankookensis]|uniref:Lipoprotein n=1 Tax=Gordonia hankookensis TaxID=589403 RepID=A0ABR7W5U5_9ACTN|nr:hypothetical protein [Gordonia hankookensis]MBD1318205.1 hypothetical protein [Gordonia hankookensis]